MNYLNSIYVIFKLSKEDMFETNIVDLLTHFKQADWSILIVQMGPFPI